MIDNERRLEIADAIEQYLNGDIDSFQLDDILVSKTSRDLACEAISAEISRFIDDFRTHYYADAKLSSEYEDGVVRWIAFLRTSVEWPQAARSRMNILKSAFAAFRSSEKTPFTKNPYWPYDTAEDWDSALGS